MICLPTGPLTDVIGPSRVTASCHNDIQTIGYLTCVAICGGIIDRYVSQITLKGLVCSVRSGPAPEENSANQYPPPIDGLMLVGNCMSLSLARRPIVLFATRLPLSPISWLFLSKPGRNWVCVPWKKACASGIINERPCQRLLLQMSSARDSHRCMYTRNSGKLTR